MHIPDYPKCSGIVQLVSESQLIMIGTGSEGVSCNFSDGCLFKLSWLCAIKVPGSAVCRAKEEHFGCLTCHCCQSTQEKFTDAHQDLLLTLAKSYFTGFNGTHKK